MRYIIKNLLCTFLIIIIFSQSVAAKLLWTTSFGVKGTNDGEFDTPYGIAMSKGGIIHVTDTFNNRLQRFNSDTSFLDKFGGIGDNEFNHPIGIDIDANQDDTIYIVDSKNNRVQRLYKELIHMGNFGHNELDRPFALSLDSLGNTVVSDLSNQIARLYNSYLENTNIVAAGSFYGITNNNLGDIYLSDGNKCDIYSKVDDNYLLKGTIGKPGEGNGQFSNLAGIAVTDDYNMYFADAGNNRIQVFIPGFNDPYRGVFKDLIETSPEGYTFSSPFDIALSDDGKIYVADSDHHRIVVLFDQRLWKSPGTTILGTLKLSEGLNLEDGYN